jgi:hypothetical protein
MSLGWPKRRNRWDILALQNNGFHNVRLWVVTRQWSVMLSQDVEGCLRMALASVKTFLCSKPLVPWVWRKNVNKSQKQIGKNKTTSNNNNNPLKKQTKNTTQYNQTTNKTKQNKTQKQKTVNFAFLPMEDIFTESPSYVSKQRNKQPFP